MYMLLIGVGIGVILGGASAIVGMVLAFRGSGFLG
jgi:hypothetical protein